MLVVPAVPKLVSGLLDIHSPVLTHDLCHVILGSLMRPPLTGVTMYLLVAGVTEVGIIVDAVLFGLKLAALLAHLDIGLIYLNLGLYHIGEKDAVLVVDEVPVLVGVCWGLTLEVHRVIVGWEDHVRVVVEL